MVPALIWNVQEIAQMQFGGDPLCQAYDPATGQAFWSPVGSSLGSPGQLVSPPRDWGRRRAGSAGSATEGFGPMGMQDLATRGATLSEWPTQEDMRSSTH